MKVKNKLYGSHRVMITNWAAQCKFNGEEELEMSVSPVSMPPPQAEVRSTSQTSPDQTPGILKRKKFLLHAEPSLP